MAEKIIEIEADSLKEAREQLKSQIPEGSQVLSERVVSDGKPQTVKTSGDTMEAALAQAQSKIPPNADILEKKESIPEQKAIKIIVEAFDEQSAKSKAEQKVKQRSVNMVTVQTVRLVAAGSKGFLGIGKKPSQYEIELLEHLPATVEITYKTKAKISAKIRKHEPGEISCPRCRHTFVPPRITIVTQAVVDRYGPNPVQCPNCKHIWSQ